LTTAPSWDLTSIFPEFDGPDYLAFRDNWHALVGDVGASIEDLGPLTADTVDAWADFMVSREKISTLRGHLGCFLGCLGAADARHDGVKAESDDLDVWDARVEGLDSRFIAAIKGADDDVWAAYLAHGKLDGLAHMLGRYKYQAGWSLPTDQELLATDLKVTGFHAWWGIYGQLTGTLEFDMETPQGTKRVPFAMKRSLMENPDAAVRKAAFVGSNREMERFAEVFAGGLNSIAGTRLTEQRWRGIDSHLEQPLESGAITRKTLDAMFGAVAERYEAPRRYLRIKARILGLDKLGFQDLSAPLPIPDRPPVDWGTARRNIEGAFESWHPDMGAFARKAFEKNWIEAEPRDGKRPGGFCTSSSQIEESRIYMTYNDTIGDVQTLAHELGHAYHNKAMRGLRKYARSYPMTLAETASTFAESVLCDTMIRDPKSTAIDRLVLLDTCLERHSAFLLNIPMRFLFEDRFYTARRSGTVSPTQLQEMMLQAQRETYADALDPEQMDPWFWASKLHFFITGVSFYNFPYTFGHLFSLGVLARAREVGPAFHDTYMALLRDTGQDKAEAVARKHLDVDLESKAFWLSCLDLVQDDLDAFEKALPLAFPDLDLKGL
jgi:oligoendopeptidase F